MVTGGAGFIGSHLTEALLAAEYEVVCLDNLSTGSKKNIAAIADHPNFKFVEGDILDIDLIKSLAKGAFAISHQAALGSVPRSVQDPITTNRVNIEGTLNVLKAAVDRKISRVVYAASSSTYGDSPALPKKESAIGSPLSPYAVTKRVNEMYAEVFHKTYGLNTIGLRYFNVFGPRQSPEGLYAAVIPLFIQAMLSGRQPIIYGDGKHSRDFTFVENAVRANMLALASPIKNYNTAYNVACGEQTSLLDLVDGINQAMGTSLVPIHQPERKGDIQHSLADISKAGKYLDYQPSVGVREGLKKTIEWHRKDQV